MRLCLVANAQSVHTQRWAKYFIGKGHEVHVLTHSKGKVEGAENHFIGPFEAPESVDYQSITQLIKISSKTKSTIKKIKPDIVHAHYLQDSAFFAARSGFHPLVVSAWGSDVIIYLYRNRAYRLMTLYVLKKADAIHSVGEHLTSKLIELGTKPEKIVTVPMGADLSEFNPNIEPTEAENNIIISTRSLEQVYNIQTLIKAAPKVVKKVRDAKFVIVGEGEEKKNLKKLATELKITDHIKFTGAVRHEDISKWLRSAKVYVSTSLSDGTSASLLEAMACGVFPVVSNIPANQPWIRDGENGFLVPRNDPELLAKKIVDAMKNDKLRDTAMSINQRLVRERADWQNNMNEIEQLYFRLVGLD